MASVRQRRGDLVAAGDAELRNTVVRWPSIVRGVTMLAQLTRARPDIRAIGTDLTESMLDTGRGLLRAAGLADRVEPRRADMTALPADLPPGSI